MKKMIYLCIAAAIASAPMVLSNVANAGPTIAPKQKVKPLSNLRYSIKADQGWYNDPVKLPKNYAYCNWVHSQPSLWQAYNTLRAQTWNACQKITINQKYGQSWLPGGDKRWNDVNGTCGKQDRNGKGFFQNSNQGDAKHLGTFSKYCIKYKY
jgi:hypothetical protein